jgi:hypothetical protein
MCEMELMELTLDRSDYGEDSERRLMFNKTQEYDDDGQVLETTLNGVDGDDVTDDAKSVEQDRDIGLGDLISPLTNRSPNFNEGSPAGYAVAEAMAAQARALREVCALVICFDQCCVET